MSSLRAAVIGSTGYIGMQCVSLLRSHPHVELTRVTGRTGSGKRFCDVVPGSDLELTIEDTIDGDSADVIFAALPHTLAAQHAQRWLSSGAVVIDLSADFRLKDSVTYERWYGARHPSPDLCVEAVYGMAEFQQDTLRSADLIAVPGCYPTAALLATLPLLQQHLVELDIVVDAKSGVSGAGRSPQLSTSFAEVSESVHAYGVAGHRHKAEMLEQLNAIAGNQVRLAFVPHLVPMTRGILATVYLRPSSGVAPAAVVACLREVYGGSSFVRVVDSPPKTKSVAGSNVAALHAAVQDDSVIVTVAIDNLLKGAAGQAVQDMNIRFGFTETAGLASRAVWP